MSDNNITFLINELKENLNHETDDHPKVYLIISFCRKHFSVLDDFLYSFILKGIDMASENNFTPEVYILKSYKVFYLLHYEKRKEALNICNYIIPALLKLKFYAEYGLSVLVNCILEWSKGNLEKPFLILNKSLDDLKHKKNKKAALAHVYYSYAVFYFDLNELKQAHRYYTLAQKNSDEITDIGLVLYTKIGLAAILKKQGDYLDSLNFLEETLSLARDNYLWNTESRVYYELGTVCQLKNQLKKAKDYFFESYEIRNKNKAYPAMVSSLVCIAQVCFDQELYQDSKKHLIKALDICKSKGLTFKLIGVYKLFSSLFEKLKDFETSLKYYKQFNALQRELSNNEINIKNKFFRLNYKYKREPELVKKTRYLNVINSFAEGFLKANSVDEIVWMVAREAIGKLGYEDCVVYLFDENNEYLIQKAAWGPKNPIEFDIHHPIKLKPGLGIVGSVARSGIGEIVNDTTKDDRYFLDDQSRLSEITVPIIADGKVIGIIDSENRQKNFYSSDDLKTLTTIASMTSSRLAQAFAMEKLNLQQKMLEETVRSKTKELQIALNHLQITNVKLSSSNDEKGILLKEVHHRVKNNLQIITSLLSLQSFSIEDQKTKDLFDNSQYRINAMALIHEMLYQSDNLSMINYADYLKRLINNLVTTFKGIDYNIKILMDITDMYLSIDTAIPLGLMINEIITNSLKYAFTDNKQGTLYLKIFEKNQQGQYIMEIGDDGPGYSDDILKTRKKSLGMQLIYKLIQQINGEINRNMEKKGTHYHIYFENV